MIESSTFQELVEFATEIMFSLIAQRDVITPHDVILS